jgi:hypothetical protein
MGIPRMMDKIVGRRPGLFLYGLAPPKRDTPAADLARIAAQQQARLEPLGLDGLIVYDLQDEAARMSSPRPFPFLPTIDPLAYAHEHLAGVTLPKIVYRCVSGDTPERLAGWLDSATAAAPARVLVGAPSRLAPSSLALDAAYDIARGHAPEILVGGIAIAERHARGGGEHERIVAKTDAGCRFFVTQAVYDVTATKSLLSDYAVAIRERGADAMPIVITLSPCGSEKTLAFMQWLGIAFPRWLENELRHAPDPLETSVRLCERIFAEIWEYARDKGVPLGVNVESVSARKAEIEASLELARRLRAIM